MLLEVASTQFANYVDHWGNSVTMEQVRGSSFGLNFKTSEMKKPIHLLMMTTSLVLISSLVNTCSAFNLETDPANGFEIVQKQAEVSHDGIFLLAGFSCLTALLILMAYRSRKPVEVRLMRVVAIILLLISALNVAQGSVCWSTLARWVVVYSCTYGLTVVSVGLAIATANRFIDQRADAIRVLHPSFAFLATGNGYGKGY